jgi:hypothetical protein
MNDAKSEGPKDFKDNFLTGIGILSFCLNLLLTLNSNQMPYISSHQSNSVRNDHYASVIYIFLVFLG